MRTRMVLLLSAALVACMLTGAGTVSAQPTPRAPGEEFWIARYNGALNGFDSARDVAVGANGARVFVTGSAEGTSGAYGKRADYATVAYDSVSGAQAWATLFNGTGNGNDFANAVVASPDSTRVFVTGASDDGKAFDYVTIAYDAGTGAQLWASTYQSLADNDDQATALGVSSDGSKVLVTGFSRGSYGGFDFATVAYNAATGTQLWVSRYNGPAMSGDFARALAVSTDGTKVFVTGDSVGSGTAHQDYATVAYGTTAGTQLWVARYSSPGYSLDYPSAIAVSPTGDKVFVTGNGKGKKSFDYLTLGYNAGTGARVWARRFNGAGTGFDSARAVIVTPDGTKVLVTGYTWEGGTGAASRNDYTSIAYAAGTGGTLWNSRYNSPGNRDDYASDLVMSPDGSKAYVTGHTTGFDDDYLAVVYAVANGATLWATRYDGPPSGTDSATAIAVRPDDSTIYVTGESWGGYSTGVDYATIAYKTA